MTGVIEVRTLDGVETVILTEAETGTIWTLVGDVASELRQSWGLAATIRGTVVPSEIMPDSGRPALEVFEYAFEGEPDGGASEP